MQVGDICDKKKQVLLFIELCDFKKKQDKVDINYEGKFSYFLFLQFYLLLQMIMCTDCNVQYKNMFVFVYAHTTTTDKYNRIFPIKLAGTIVFRSLL